MNVIYAGCSRPGLVRSINEDALLMCSTENGALFLVADGIGGRRCGEVVSGMLRDGYQQWWTERFLPSEADMGFADALRELQEVLRQQNQAVIARYGQRAAGSTLALLFLFRGNCLYLSAGDSRIYRGRGLHFQQVTVDDIYENLSEEDRRLGDAGNGKLTGAIGLWSVPEYRIRTDVLRSGDRFFLCSDGVYRYAGQRLLGRTVRRALPEHVVDEVSREVERGGAGDNYTMICVRVRTV